MSKKVRKNARRSNGRSRSGNKSRAKRGRTWSVIQQIVQARKSSVIKAWTRKNYNDTEIIKAMQGILKYTKIKKVPLNFRFIYTVANKYYIPLIHRFNHKFNDYKFIWSIPNFQTRGYVIGLHMVIRLYYFYFRDTYEKEIKKNKSAKGLVGQTNIKPIPICFITHCYDKYSKTDSKVKDGSAKVGEVKPAHNHWVMKFPKRVYSYNVAEWIGVQSNYCSSRGGSNQYGFSDLLAYLVHAKSPKKHQYRIDDVWCDKNVINYQEYAQTHASDWKFGALAKKANDEIKYAAKHKNVMVMLVHHCIIHPNDIFAHSNNYGDKHYEITFSYHQKSMEKAFKFQQDKIGHDSTMALANHRYRKISIYIWGESDVGKTTFDRKLSNMLRKRMNWDWAFQCQGEPNPFDDYSNQEVVRDEEAGRGDGLYGRILKATLERSDVTPVHARYFNRMMTAHVIMFTSTNPFLTYLKYLPDKNGDPLNQYSRRFDYVVHLIEAPSGKRYAMVSHLIKLPDDTPLRLLVGSYKDQTGEEHDHYSPFTFLHYPYQEHNIGSINKTKVLDGYIPEQEALEKLVDIIAKANDPNIYHKAEVHPEMTLDEYSGDKDLANAPF